MKNSSKVSIVPYDPNWPIFFDQVRIKIKGALGTQVQHIHHIGSTAIPAMDAKPIIDILVEVKDITKVNIENMQNLGYKSRGEMGMPFRSYFSNGEYHVHVWEKGCDEIERLLLFRNYLIAHPEDAEEYKNLKKELAQKYPQQRPIYTASKSPFIKKIVLKSGFQGYGLEQVLHPDQWQIYYKIYKSEISDCHPEMTYDEQHPDLQNPNTFYFLFSKATEVIGIAHVELLSSSQAILINMATTKDHQGQGFESVFLKSMEKWGHQKGCLLNKIR